MKKCERCTREAIRGGRFCIAHHEQVASEMQASGYLETGGYGGHKGQSRTSGMKENQHETKHGRD